MNVLTLTTDDWLLPGSSKPKTPEVFSEDPVVLACGAYRLRSYIDLGQVEPTNEDRVLGAQVRKHFMDKLIVQRLKGQTLSNFREKLGAFLVDNRPIYRDELGILYHLPYFYFEDIFQNDIVEATTPVQVEPPAPRQVRLIPFAKQELKRRSGAIQQYWWVDDARHPYCLSVRNNNDANVLCNSIWNFPNITISATIFVKSFFAADRNYYKLTSTKLLDVGHV